MSCTPVDYPAKERGESNAGRKKLRQVPSSKLSQCKLTGFVWRTVGHYRKVIVLSRSKRGREEGRKAWRETDSLEDRDENHPSCLYPKPFCYSEFLGTITYG